MSNHHQTNSKSTLLSGFKSSWKGLVALALFFIIISLIFKWVASPISNTNSTSPSMAFVANDSIVDEIAKTHRLPQQQVRSLLRLHHRYCVLNRTLQLSIDSVNQLKNSAKELGDTLLMSKLILNLLELDIKWTENRYHFYTSVKEATSKGRALELISALNCNN